MFEAIPHIAMEPPKPPQRPGNPLTMLERARESAQKTVYGRRIIKNYLALVQPKDTLQQLFTDIQQMRNTGRSSENYLAQLPPELRDQIILIIDQELLGPLPQNVQNHVRQFLNGRVWVDLSDDEKFELIKIIISHYPIRGAGHYWSGDFSRARKENWELISFISYLLSLKEFSSLANSRDIIIAIINKLHEVTTLGKFPIAAGLDTPESIAWFKKELLKSRSPNREIMNTLICDILQHPFNKDIFVKIAKNYIIIAPKFRVNLNEPLFDQSLFILALRNKVPYDLIKLLVENGVDVNAQTQVGTPLAIAQQTEGLDPRIIPLLLEHGATLEGNPSQETSTVEAEEEA